MKKQNKESQKSKPNETGKIGQNNRARRRLIQTLAVSGGIISSKLIPNKWAAPTVESVVLPAHASGSTCTLGNTSAVEFLAQSQPAEPVVDPGSLTEKVLDSVLPTADAGTTSDQRGYELTGCFWIDFLCNSNTGFLSATVIDTGSDGAVPADPITVKFINGVCEELEEVPGYWFKVVLGEGGGSAILYIAPEQKICANNQGQGVDLVPNFNCLPFVFDDTPVPKGP